MRAPAAPCSDREQREQREHEPGERGREILISFGPEKTFGRDT